MQISLYSIQSIINCKFFLKNFEISEILELFLEFIRQALYNWSFSTFR
jgi:hypothetical protein